MRQDVILNTVKAPSLFGLQLSGLKIVVDCADGATYHVAPSCVSELGAEVISIGVNPDGLNIMSLVVRQSLSCYVKMF